MYFRLYKHNLLCFLITIILSTIFFGCGTSISNKQELDRHLEQAMTMPICTYEGKKLYVKDFLEGLKQIKLYPYDMKLEKFKKSFRSYRKFKDVFDNYIKGKTLLGTMKEEDYLNSEDYLTILNENPHYLTYIRMLAMEPLVESLEPQVKKEQLTLDDLEKFAKVNDIDFQPENKKQQEWLRKKLLPKVQQTVSEKFYQKIIDEAVEKGKIEYNLKLIDTLSQVLFEIPRFLDLLNIDRIIYNYLQMHKDYGVKEIEEFVKTMYERVKDKPYFEITDEHLEDMDKLIVDIPDVVKVLTVRDIVAIHRHAIRSKAPAEKALDEFINDYKQKFPNKKMKIKIKVSTIKDFLNISNKKVLKLDSYKDVDIVEMINLGAGKLESLREGEAKRLLDMLYVKKYAFYVKGLAKGLDTTDDFKKLHQIELNSFNLKHFTNYKFDEIKSNIKDEEKIEAYYEKHKKEYVVDRDKNKRKSNQKKKDNNIVQQMTFSQAKNFVISDMANEKFSDWMDNLQQKRNVKINKDFLKAMKIYFEAKKELAENNKKNDISKKNNQ